MRARVRTRVDSAFSGKSRKSGSPWSSIWTNGPSPWEIWTFKGHLDPHFEFCKLKLWELTVRCVIRRKSCNTSYITYRVSCIGHVSRFVHHVSHNMQNMPYMRRAVSWRIMLCLITTNHKNLCRDHAHVTSCCSWQRCIIPHASHFAPDVCVLCTSASCIIGHIPYIGISCSLLYHDYFVGRLSYVFVGFLFLARFARISPEIHWNFIGISPEFIGISTEFHRNFARISPEFRQNDELEHLKKEDDHNLAHFAVTQAVAWPLVRGVIQWVRFVFCLTQKKTNKKLKDCKILWLSISMLK